MKWNAQGEAESLPYPPRDSYRNKGVGYRGSLNLVSQDVFTGTEF